MQFHGHPGKGGFSLTEVLVVLAILSVTILPTWASFRYILNATRTARCDLRASSLLEYRMAEVHSLGRAGIAPQPAFALKDGPLNGWTVRQSVRPADNATASGALLYQIDLRVEIEACRRPAFASFLLCLPAQGRGQTNAEHPPGT